jgi:phosphoglucomutase
MQAHWREFGRNYYARHDHEGLDTHAANGAMEHLRGMLPSLGGHEVGGMTVAAADDFAYHDPVDGSTTAAQGLRFLFEGGARIVFRLSGTGTTGATLRIYLERYEPDPGRHGLATEEALADLVGIAAELSELKARTGRTAPTVVT